jgi:hypothetical protein
MHRFALITYNQIGGVEHSSIVDFLSVNGDAFIRKPDTDNDRKRKARTDQSIGERADERVRALSIEAGRAVERQH